MAESSEISTHYSQSAEASTDAGVELTIDSRWSGDRLDSVLAALLPEYSRSRLQGWIREGRVTVNSAVVEPKHKLSGGERVQVRPVARAQDASPAAEQRELAVLFEDAHLLVIDKPPGLVVHPGHGNWSGTLMNALLHHVPNAAQLPRAGIVHRLDKDTSGVMVVAKMESTQLALTRMIAARKVSRIYQAVVRGRIERKQTIDAPIGRHPKERTRMAVVPAQKGRSAQTLVEPLKLLPQHTLVKCTLATGRTHQIRVHLAHVGHPIEGDPVYASKSRDATHAFPRQALHAWHLSFEHPETQEALSFEAPLPADIQQLLKHLSKA